MWITIFQDKTYFYLNVSWTNLFLPKFFIVRIFLGQIYLNPTCTILEQELQSYVWRERRDYLSKDAFNYLTYFFLFIMKINPLYLAIFSFFLILNSLFLLLILSFGLWFYLLINHYIICFSLFDPKHEAW